MGGILGSCEQGGGGACTSLKKETGVLRQKSSWGNRIGPRSLVKGGEGEDAAKKVDDGQNPDSVVESDRGRGQKSERVVGENRRSEKPKIGKKKIRSNG